MRFLVPIVLMIAGVALLAGFTVSNHKASSSDHWAQALGTITQGGSGGNEVAYRYAVSGREYTAKSTTHLGNYATGSTLIVYFDPANAASSTLELGRRPSPWLWVSGTFAFVVGLILAIFFSRSAAGRAGGRRGGKRPPPRKTANRPMQRLKPPAGIPRPDAPPPAE